MELDFWESFGNEKPPLYNQITTVSNQPVIVEVHSPFFSGPISRAHDKNQPWHFMSWADVSLENGQGLQKLIKFLRLSQCYKNLTKTFGGSLQARNQDLTKPLFLLPMTSQVFCKAVFLAHLSRRLLGSL